MDDAFTCIKRLMAPARGQTSLLQINSAHHNLPTEIRVHQQEQYKVAEIAKRLGVECSVHIRFWGCRFIVERLSQSFSEAIETIALH